MKKTLHASRYLAFDFFASFIAWVLFYFLRKHLLDEQLYGGLDYKLFIGSIVIASIWTVIYFLTGAYYDVVRKSRIKEVFSLFANSLIGSVIIFFVFLLDDEGVLDYHSYYSTLGSYWALHLTIAIVVKMIVMTDTKAQIKNGKIFFNTLIIGANKQAKDIYDEIEKNKHFLGFRFISYLTVSDIENKVIMGSLRNMGSVSNLEKVIRRCKIEQVVIAVSPSEHQILTDILNRLEGFNLKISIIPDIYQMLIGSVSVNHVFGVPLIEIDRKIMPLWQQSVKRIIDIIFSIIVLVLGFPFLGTCAIITKITSKGPIFFTQERIGKYGIPFKIIKFRSMLVDAELKGPQLSTDKDPRITSWGRFMRKTRIDEFPQFWNVLIGDMSLVGPRPERQFFIDQIIEKAPHYRHLNKVRPGITSLGQVKYGYAENVEQMVQRLQFDIIYIENMSLVMDFRIIFYTILTVISAKGK